MKYYSALKRKEILIHDATCLDLDDMLSEISQSLKDKYCVLLLISLQEAVLLSRPAIVTLHIPRYPNRLGF